MKERNHGGCVEDGIVLQRNPTDLDRLIFLNARTQWIGQHRGDQLCFRGVDLITSIGNGLDKFRPVITARRGQLVDHGVEVIQFSRHRPVSRKILGQRVNIKELLGNISLGVPCIRLGQVLPRKRQQFVISVYGENVTTDDSGGVFEEFGQTFQLNIDRGHADILSVAAHRSRRRDHRLIRIRIHVRFGPEYPTGGIVPGRDIPLFIVIPRPRRIIVVIVVFEFTGFVPPPKETPTFRIGRKGVRFRPNTSPRDERLFAFIIQDVLHNPPIGLSVRLHYLSQIRHGGHQRLGHTQPVVQLRHHPSS